VRDNITIEKPIFKQRDIREVFQYEVKEELQINYPEAFKISGSFKQRGALRALTCG
jgi:hypothetical protein